jgi:CheY-like chemotaxis protein
MAFPRRDMSGLPEYSAQNDPFESTTQARLTTRPTSFGDQRRVTCLYDDEVDLANGAHLRTTAPPSAEFAAFDGRLAPPEHVLHKRFDDLARRIEMLTALLQTDGLTRAQGARALHASLSAIAANAEEAKSASLGNLARSLRGAVAELIPDAAIAAEDALDVIVVDSSEISRDFAALAVEAQGHIVTSAQSYDELVTSIAERLPDVIIVEISDGKTPPRQVCASLANLLEGLPTQLLIFSGLSPSDFREFQRLANATAIVSKELGLPMLLAELESIADVCRSRRGPT